MKNKYIIFVGLVLTLLSTGCEKEIDIDLHSLEPRLVINASLKEREACKVKLTMTQDYWDTNPAPIVSGAIITISDELGNSEVLQEMKGEGVYYSLMMGLGNRTYTLDVEVDNKVYSATSYLPKPIQIDSLYIYSIDFGHESMYLPCILFTDPKDEVNYYYLNLNINDKAMQHGHAEEDKYINGLTKEFPIYFDKEENDDEKLQVGDKIKVEMQSIDKGTFDFYDSISGQGAVTSNPKSNFSGGVLGLFKTYSHSVREIIITEKHLE